MKDEGGRIREACGRGKILSRLALAWLLIGLAAVSRPAISVEQTALPAGPGAELIKQRCLTCHQADLITQQQLTRARWSKELDKMVRWGAEVPDGERESMLTYLVAHFGDSSPKSFPASAALPPGSGTDVVKRHCLVCHKADIIMDQYLTRAQWGKELDKMARWGSTFSPEDRETMLEYLTAHFGPQAIQAP